MPHFFISAAHKSSGKTTLSLGLTAAFMSRGMRVQTFKKGPDYIDPLWLTAASGRSCRNLDFFTMSQKEIETEFSSFMSQVDMGIIEGNKGLFDGLDLEGKNSNAALASLLGSPVLLVIDARGMTRGIAPLILGYQAFDKSIQISGVILNKVGGSRHEGKLRAVIEHYTDVPVVGAVHYGPSLKINERHLGLMPSNEADKAQQKIRALGDAISSQVDLDRILSFACPVTSFPEKSSSGTGDALAEEVRIGYPKDRAFGFYYPGDLEKLEGAGAKLVPFDTEKATNLPVVDGLFLGGGFPETAMTRLQNNRTLRVDILEFIEKGGPVYAECGGLMYLARSLTWRGTTCEMVGAIPADVVMHDRPQGRGYVLLKETGESPWPSQPGEGVSDISAHEFHYSALENLPRDTRFAYRVLRGEGIDGLHDGIVYKNLLASYTHLRDVGGNRWTSRFLSHVDKCKKLGEVQCLK